MSEHGQDAQVAKPEPAAGPPYPALVRVAGIIWIVAGVLFLVWFGGLLVYICVQVARGELPDTGSVAASFVLLGVLVMGSVLFVRNALHLAFPYRWPVRGTPRYRLGMDSGISIACGGLLLCVGIPWLVVAANFVSLGISLAGAALILAGVLALVGRRDYRAWREAHEAGSARERP
jgi:LPXTG-motif cell wall-anchored protein